MVVLSFVKYANIHNAINFTFSIPCDAYLDIFYGLLRTFSSGPLRFCQQKHFSSLWSIYIQLVFSERIQRKHCLKVPCEGSIFVEKCMQRTDNITNKKLEQDPSSQFFSFFSHSREFSTPCADRKSVVTY